MYVASLTGMTREKRNHIRHHQPQKPTVRESGVAPQRPWRLPQGWWVSSWIFRWFSFCWPSWEQSAGCRPHITGAKARPDASAETGSRRGTADPHGCGAPSPSRWTTVTWGGSLSDRRLPKASHQDHIPGSLESRCCADAQTQVPIEEMEPIPAPRSVPAIVALRCSATGWLKVGPLPLPDAERPASPQYQSVDPPAAPRVRGREDRQVKLDGKRIVRE